MSASPPVNLLGLSAMLSPSQTSAAALHEAGETMRGRSRERRILAKSPPQAIPQPRPAAPVVSDKLISPLASPRLDALRRPSMQASHRLVGTQRSPQSSPKLAPAWLPLGDRRLSEDRPAPHAPAAVAIEPWPRRSADQERPESPFFGEMSPFGSRSPSLSAHEPPASVTRDDILLAHRFLPVRIRVRNHPEWQVRLPAPHRKLHLLDVNLGPAHFELLDAPSEVRHFYGELLAQAHTDWLSARERFSILLFCAQNTVERGGHVAPDWLFLQARDLLEGLGRLRGHHRGGGESALAAGELV